MNTEYIFIIHIFINTLSLTQDMNLYNPCTLKGVPTAECQKDNIYSTRRGNAWIPNRRNLIPCTVRTKEVQSRSDCLLCKGVRI